MEQSLQRSLPAPLKVGSPMMLLLVLAIRSINLSFDPPAECPDCLYEEKNEEENEEKQDTLKDEGSVVHHWIDLRYNSAAISWSPISTLSVSASDSLATARSHPALSWDSMSSDAVWQARRLASRWFIRCLLDGRERR